MIDYDLSRRPGRPSEWLALAAAVLASTEPEENYWLEEKSRLDWEKPHGTGTLAKAILALANRDPQRASTVLEGRGVVIVTEIEPLDNADLENKLAAYVGGSDGPRWEPHWVRVDDKPVLVIEVDAPQGGDPPYTLRQKFDDYRATQVFVRETGKTVLASQADTVRLARRLLATETADTLDVVLGFTTEKPMSTYFWDDTAVEAFIAGDESRLLKSLADIETERARAAAAKAAEEKAAVDAAAAASLSSRSAPSAMYNLGSRSRGEFDPTGGFAAMSDAIERQARLLTGGLTETHKEDRTPEAFTAEVARYAKGAREAMPEALATIARRVVPLPTFWLTNLAERNYTAVEVTIRVAGEAEAESRDWEEEVRLRTMLPKLPRKYGPWKSTTALGGIFASQGFGNYAPVLPPMDYGVASASRREIQNGGSFRARFDPINLRPGDREMEVESDLVILVPRDRVEPVVVRWEATASNVDAIARGEFVLPFDGEPIDVLEAGQ